MLWFCIVSECFDSYVFVYSHRAPKAVSILSSALWIGVVLRIPTDFARLPCSAFSGHPTPCTIVNDEHLPTFEDLFRRKSRRSRMQNDCTIRRRAFAVEAPDFVGSQRCRLGHLYITRASLRAG